MTSEKRIRQVERRIGRIKQELMKIGPLRPGSLTRQYKNPKAKSGSFWQISYTRTMKSRTEYVRPQFVTNIRRQIAAYKRFRSLTEEWIELSIESSKLNMQIEINKPSM